MRLEHWLYTIPLRLRSLFRRHDVERELDEEIRFHVERQIVEATARGEDPQAARRRVAVALGGSEQVKELCRDARRTRWLEDLWQDAEYALRTFRQKPGFAAIALWTSALGIAATTVMFTVINGVLLKPRPYPDPERLVSVHEQVDNSGQWAFAYLNFLDCQRESRTLGPMAAWRSGMGGTVSEPGEAEHVSSREISAGVFPVLEIRLLHGRGFTPDEDRPGGAPVAIISYRLWRTRFGGDPKAVGARLVFEAKAYTVIGIGQQDFSFRETWMYSRPWARTQRPGCKIAKGIRAFRLSRAFGQAWRSLKLRRNSRCSAVVWLKNIPSPMRATALRYSHFDAMLSEMSDPHCGYFSAPSASCF